MIILSIQSAGHDAAVSVFKDYQLIAAVQHERITRQKGQGGWPEETIDEAIEIAGLSSRKEVDVVLISYSGILRRYIRFPGIYKLFNWYASKIRGKQCIRLVRLLQKVKSLDAKRFFRHERFLQDHGFRSDAQVDFYSHHVAHALSAFFFTTWDDALIYTADALGDNVQYSAHVVKDGQMTSLFGGEESLLESPEADSVARAYAYATEAIGFRSFRHEGKLTGLAAYGKPVLLDEMSALFYINDAGKICGHFRDNAQLRQKIYAMAERVSKEDMAASVQALLEKFILASIQTLLEKYPSKHLALAGGVFANVRLNALLKEKLALEEIFICPAMGDEGMVVGGPLHYLLKRDGFAHWMKQRYRLENVYLGKNYTGEVDIFFQNIDEITVHKSPVKKAAKMIAEGKIGAIYHGRMEFGPRALGARSIIASPVDQGINQTLNERLQRTEFMPFAPYVLEQDAADVFEIDQANLYACRFMTITTPVKEAWQSKIPAVVHIDGTARPQVVTREQNALYYDILAQFKKETDLPVLVNTSFNAHEEPIINSPKECFRALKDGRVDFIVTEKAVYSISR